MIGKSGEVWKYQVMGKYGGGGGGGGGGVMELGNVSSGVQRPPSLSQPLPRPPSRPRLPRLTLPLPLPRMGCIRTGVDDIGGLMDVHVK